MRVFRFVLWVALLFMPLGCESISSIRTIATNALTLRPAIRPFSRLL
jgi:hypothetical protein